LGKLGYEVGVFTLENSPTLLLLDEGDPRGEFLSPQLRPAADARLDWDVA